ncbi:MAG: phytanoyl-CoA dioxygenase family protein [Planctomycetes bacterium]|nr:phytanoyl-CoA dioxygenase family protein [Planctomycetota bacterium]
MDAQFEHDGWSVHRNVLPRELHDALTALFATHAAAGPGVRSGLDHAAVRALAKCAAVRALVEPILGPAAFCHRATLFDKHDAANWTVAWHQDRVVPVQERIDAAGFGPWSDKPGCGVHVQPPATVLANLLAVRVDLDGSHAANGGLCVLPGSHRSGVLSRDAIATFVATVPPFVPEVPPGGALRLRPLLLHSSPRVASPSHRRIVHLEFAPCELPDPVRFRVRV